MSKRLLAAALAAYTIVVVSGAPLPLATVSTWVAAWRLPDAPQAPGAERFPCEACPCGCGTAEHCWNDCCCHTMPQRLAWAKKTGVRPPESALDSAEQAGLDTSDWRAAREQRVVVTVPAKKASTEATPLADLPPCCRQARLAAESCDASPEDGKTPAPKSPADPGVALLSAMACQGLAEAWMALGEAPIPAAPAFTEADAFAVVSQSPATLWRPWTEAPTPPPPDGRG